MKKNLCAMMLAGSVLLGLTACSSDEPLVSRDVAATGSAVSGNSVTGDAVSGGAVESNSKDRQIERDKESTEKGKSDIQWSQWFRNCNSNKMYRITDEDEMYSTTDEDDEETPHLVQIDLDGKGKKKVLKTKADEVLWVTDEWICINFGSRIYRIPIKPGPDQAEVLDTTNKECIISDYHYDGPRLFAMDDNAIYYSNRVGKIFSYNITNGIKKEVEYSDDMKDITDTEYSYVTDSKVFFKGYCSLYCIHRDTLEIEKIDSCGKGEEYGNNFIYMEETDELYYTHVLDDRQGLADTELYVYDGDTTRCVVSCKEIDEVFLKIWKIPQKTMPKTMVPFYIYKIYCCGDKIYMKYSIDIDDKENNYGVLVYDRNGELYKEEKLAEQAKKYFVISDNFYDYYIYDVQGDKMYLVDYEEEYSYSYDLKTGKMKRVSAETANLLEITESYHKSEFDTRYLHGIYMSRRGA